MSDLIDRQKVLNTLDFADKALDEDRTVETYKELLTECVKVLPSAENKGEWIDNGNGSYTCSNCKTEWTTSQIEKMCFCPTCGADMREPKGEKGTE